MNSIQLVGRLDCEPVPQAKGVVFAGGPIDNAYTHTGEPAAMPGAAMRR